MPGLAAFLFLGLHLRQLRRLHAELEEILHFSPLQTVHRPAAIHSAEFGHLALDLLLGRHLSLQEVLLQQRQRQSRRGQDLGWALDLRRLRRLRRRRGRGHRGWHRAPRQGPQHAAQPRADLCHGGRHRSEKDLMPTFVGTRLRAALAVGEHINAQHTLHQIGNCIPSIPLTFPGNFASPTTPRPQKYRPYELCSLQFSVFLDLQRLCVLVQLMG